MKYSDLSTFIRPLPNTALDVIGDVHGEWEALQQLLHFLGYDDYGRHQHGRKLVFVGDLCDRGPNSPAVLDWVIQAAASENAFTIIGNHELNLLINDPKDGAGWYFDNRPQDEARFAPWQHYPAAQRRQLQETIAQWPLLLQRDDLRIVHAAWLPESIDKLLECSETSLVKQYHYWEDRFLDDFRNTQWYEPYQQEQRQLNKDLENEHYPMTFQAGTAHYDLLRSCHNPIRALTSGIQAITQQPFYINGRWRFTVRKPWWQQYTDPVAVIIGHYWRSWYGTGVAEHRKELFQEPPTHWLGQQRQVFCVDFSIGARWRERKKAIAVADSQMHLAALRWPENIIMLNNGKYYHGERYL